VTQVYHVEALNLETGVRLRSPALSVNDSEYTLPDLAVDTAYELCVVSTGAARPACAVLSTIPRVRVDSIIALLIALAILGAVILIAVVLWRCAVRRAGGAAGDDEPSEEKPPDADDDPALNEKSPLLVPAVAGTDQAGPPPSAADPTAAPAGTEPPSDPGKQEQPQSLYLFLAGHAFK